MADRDVKAVAIEAAIFLNEAACSGEDAGGLMAELSREEVVGIVGPIGDAAIAEIIGTGISNEELSAAHHRVVRDQTAHNPGEPLDPGRFAEVVEILERLRRRGILGESGSVLE